MRQMKEWEEYFQIEPWGDDQHEGRNGLLCSLLANVNRDSKAKPEPFKPQDFMRGIPGPERELTPEEIDAHFDRIFGG